MTPEIISLWNCIVINRELISKSNLWNKDVSLSNREHEWEIAVCFDVQVAWFITESFFDHAFDVLTHHGKVHLDSHFQCFPFTFACIRQFTHSRFLLMHPGCHQRIICGHSRYRQRSGGIAPFLVNIQYPWCPTVLRKVPRMRRSSWWKSFSWRCSKQNRMSPLSGEIYLEECRGQFW